MRLEWSSKSEKVDFDENRDIRIYEKGRRGLIGGDFRLPEGGKTGLKTETREIWPATFFYTISSLFTLM